MTVSISVTNGRITIHRRTVEQVQQAEAEAENELERLEAVAADEPDYREVAEPHQQLLKYQRAELEPPFELAAWTARQTLWADGGETA
jgi:CHASE3 domain sensor protein